MNHKRIIGGIGANVYDKLIVAGVQLAGLPMLASHWGLELYGIWLILATVPGIMGLSDFGLATAAGTSMTMLAARDEQAQAVVVFHSAWAFILGVTCSIGAVSLVIVWLLPASILPAATSISAFEVRLTLSALLLYGMVCLQGGIMTAGFRCSGHYSFGMYCAANTILAENLCMICSVGYGAGPVGASVALLTVRSLSVLLQSWLLEHKVRWLSIGFRRASHRTLRALLKPAAAVMALPAAQACILQGTTMALGMAASSAAVPVFTAARTLSRLSLQLPLLVNHALLPEFSVASARADTGSQSKLFRMTLLSSAVLAFPIAIVLAVFGPKLVSVWSEGAIRPEHTLMLLMAGATLLGSLWVPVSNLFLAINRQSEFSYFYATVAVLILPIAYFGSLSFGPLGAGLAVIASDACMFIFVLRLSSSHLPFPSKSLSKRPKIKVGFK